MSTYTVAISAVAALFGASLGAFVTGLLTQRREYKAWLRAEQAKVFEDLLAACETARTDNGSSPVRWDILARIDVVAPDARDAAENLVIATRDFIDEQKKFDQSPAAGLHLIRSESLVREARGEVIIAVTKMLRGPRLNKQDRDRVDKLRASAAHWAERRLEIDQRLEQSRESAG